MTVTAAQGWTASGVHAGTKAPGTPDLAVVFSEQPAGVAAAFTTNKAVCGHIIVCRPRVAAGTTHGVVVSAGIANARNGPQEVADAEKLAAMAAKACRVAPEHMLVCTTGKIGPALPVDALEPGVQLAAASLSREGGVEAARAIWTTDTSLKTSVRTLQAGGVTVTVGGMAKGAAMIAPRMQVPHATMLAFLTTDVQASAPALGEALRDGLPTTFNAITIDGSTSTNDTVLLMANGATGVPIEQVPGFADAVREVMGELAYAIAADGEGATKVIRVVVSGAASAHDAETAAREVAGSILLRSALWAGEPKWGWVIQQLGQADVSLDPDRISVTIAGVPLYDRGNPTGRDVQAQARMSVSELVVEADLGLGSASFEMLTCDISPEFPKLQLGT